MPSPLKVRDDIDWVGALDYDIRVFDIIMHTEYGTTYNAFVLKGNEKTVLFEVAKEAFFDEFFERLRAVTPPEDIDYIVLDHTEPDHTGSLQKLLPYCPKATVVATTPGIRFISQILNHDFKKLAVKDGDVIDIGGKTLRFIMAPFLHWPDTMFTYVPECKTLFTCDAFGCHFADAKVFNDEITGDFYDAYKYYFDNILGPFKDHVAEALNKIEPLSVETICNGHGPVIRTDTQKYIDMYRKWSKPVVNAKPVAVVAFVSAYGYTKQLAEKIAEGLKTAGDIEVRVYDMVYDDTQAAAADLERADGVILGSPTLVGDALPPISNILQNFNPNYHRGKIVGLFGSYGWSGEAVPNLETRVKQLKWKMPVPSLKVQFKPTEAQLKDAIAFGLNFGNELLKKDGD